MFRKAEEGRKRINAHTIKPQEREEAQSRHCWEQEKTKIWQSQAIESGEHPSRIRQENPKVLTAEPD